MKKFDVLIEDYPNILTKYNNNFKKESEELFKSFQKIYQNKIIQDRRNSQIEKILKSDGQ